jgi:hypothetical protein
MSDEIRDGDWTLVEHDPEMGRSIWHLHQDGMDHFRIDFAVEKTLEMNKAEYNAADRGWKGDWVKVASLPHNILHDSGLEEANQQRDQKWISRFLNDPDNRGWRTKPGRV